MQISQRVSRFYPAAKAALCVLLARRCVADITACGQDTAVADVAIDRATAWAEGQLATPVMLSDAVYDAQDQGVLRAAMEHAATPAGPAWNTLTTAIQYVAWLAYRQAGEVMPQDVAEVREETLDLIVSTWQTTGTYDQAYLDRAVEVLSADLLATASRVDISALSQRIDPAT